MAGVRKTTFTVLLKVPESPLNIVYLCTHTIVYIPRHLRFKIRDLV